MNKDNGDQGQGSQKSFYNNKQSFADDSVWLEIPKNGSTRLIHFP